MRFFRILKVICLSVLALLIVGGAAAWIYWYELSAYIHRRVETEISKLLPFDLEFEAIGLTFKPLPALALHKVRVLGEQGCLLLSFERAAVSAQFSGLIANSFNLSALEFEGGRATFLRSVGKLEVVGPLGDICAITPNISSAETKTSSKTLPSGEIQKIAFKDLTLIVNEGSKKHELLIQAAETQLGLDPNGIELGSPFFRASMNGIPISIRAQAFKLGLDSGTVLIEGAEFAVASQKITLAGEMGLSGRSFSIELQADDLNISRLLSLLKGSSWSNSTGVLTVGITAKQDLQGRLGVSGQAVAKNLSLPAIQLETSEIKLSKIKAAGQALSLSTLSTQLDIRDFQIKDRTDQYVTAGVQGFVEFNFKPFKALAELDVEGFGFNDGVTNLKDVSATLKEIVARFNSDKGVDVSLKLDGRAVSLESGKVKVVSAKQVQAPLRVLVPASGGYEVSGPVTVHGGELLFYDRSFSSLAGTTDMLVSGPIKSFKAARISGESMMRNIQLGGLFEMLREQYNLKNIDLQLVAGSAKLNGKLGRIGLREYNAQFEAKGVQLPDIVSVATGKEATVIGGSIDQFIGKFSGDLTQPKESLSGAGKIRVLKPFNTRFNLTSAIRSAMSRLPGVSAEEVKEAEQDKANQISSADFEVHDQKLHLKKLRIERSSYNVQGEVDLSFTGELDGRLEAVILEQNLKLLGLGIGKLGRFLGRAGRVYIPITLKGSFKEPSASLDRSRLPSGIPGLRQLGSATESVLDAVTSPFRSKSSEKDQKD